MTSEMSFSMNCIIMHTHTKFQLYIIRNTYTNAHIYTYAKIELIYCIKIK